MWTRGIHHRSILATTYSLHYHHYVVILGVTNLPLLDLYILTARLVDRDFNIAPLEVILGIRNWLLGDSARLNAI